MVWLGGLCSWCWSQGWNGLHLCFIYWKKALNCNRNEDGSSHSDEGCRNQCMVFYEELCLSELLPGTQENPFHLPECSWFGSSLGDSTRLNFSFFLSVSRRREQGEEGSTVILPKWSTAVEFEVQARSSFWKAGWFFRCFAWQNRLVPEEVHSLSSLCHSAQRKCLSVHVKSWAQGYSFSSPGLLFHRQGTLRGLTVSLFCYSAFL